MAMITMKVQENPAIKGLASEVRDELLLASWDKWDRYDNPFEQKYVLRKEAYTIHIQALLNHLRAHVIDLPPDVMCDVTDHFTAIFKYDIGDYLDLHMDAGVHPENGKRKAWTLLYYLSTNDVRGGALEFWKNENLIETQLGDIVLPDMGTTVLFKNIDGEFHGNPTPVEAGTRMVATVSFVSNSHDGFTNMRPRAYFIPRPGIREWTEETYRLRDIRCDPVEYKNAYVAKGE